MWLFPVIVTAMILPALVALVFYLLTLARQIDDPEIKARRRWRMISRGNADLDTGDCRRAHRRSPRRRYRDLAPRHGPPPRSVFVVIAYCPLVTVLGIVDRKIRGIEYSLRGYLKFQFAFFFCRWSAFLVVVVLTYVPLGFVDRQGEVSYPGIVLTVAGAALFIAVVLFQMRLIGRATGMLTAVNPDQEPARTFGGLAARAGVNGVRVSVMETSGYPFYNAFAAPGKTIYVTRPLLSALNREELSAVAAHEIGHLVTMKQRTALMLTLMTAGVVALWFVISRLAWILSDLSAFVVEIAAGVIFLAVAILLLAAVSRKYETRADATATELMGETEAVIGALEKIYALNMIPRRFDKKGSENASHPSLERRIAQLKGEKLPKPKKKIGVLLIIIISVLILVCLRLLSYYGERSLAPAYPGTPYGYTVASLEERLAEDPNDFEALKRLAIEYYSIEEDKRALETIDRALAVKRDPGLLTAQGIHPGMGGRRGRRPCGCRRRVGGRCRAPGVPLGGGPGR